MEVTSVIEMLPRYPLGSSPGTSWDHFHPSCIHLIIIPNRGPAVGRVYHKDQGTILPIDEVIIPGSRSGVRNGSLAEET